VEMDEIEYEIFEDGELVNKVTIQQIRPCVVAENMVRVLLKLDSEIKDVIPLLATKYPPGNVNYIQNKNILTLNISDRLVTLYPSGKVSMNKTVDEEDAIEVITEIMRHINQAFTELSTTGSVDYSQLNKKLANIGPLALYNCLPKTDCEKCGEATCMAFSIKLLSGDTELIKCKPLVDGGDTSCLEDLLGPQLMQTIGWKL
jgi:ArsR family metal-binding transcriptional regulator